MTMSDRLAVMRHGRVEQIGAPEAVYETPATEFVAGFLGASNLLDGELAGGDGDSGEVRLVGGPVVRVPAERLDGHAGRVKVGVRPEKISIERPGGDVPAGWNSVTGVLRMAAYVGVSHQYTVEGPGGVTLTVYEQNSGPSEVPAAGENVRLRWRPEHTFVVQPTGGPTEEEEER